jgi:hypothetical protein
MCLLFFFYELCPSTLVQSSRESCSDTELHHTKDDVNIIYLHAVYKFLRCRTTFGVGNAAQCSVLSHFISH